MAIIAFVLSYIFQDPPGDLENSTSANVFEYIYNAVFIICFTASRFKGSPGKMIMGIQVLTIAHERIGIGRSIARFFAYFISSIIFMNGYIMAAFTEDKKALHDIICGTRVVYKEH